MYARTLDAPTRVTEELGKEEVRDDVIAKIMTSVQLDANLLVASGKQSRHQAWYLPSTPDDLPIMGALSDQSKCFVATGHSCWGILMGPASGEAMAHLIASGESPHVRLSAFDPSRMKDMVMVPQQQKQQQSQSK